MKLSAILSIILLSSVLPKAGNTQEKEPLTVAVLNVYEKDQAVAGIGEKANLLLNAILSSNENIVMVEREELHKSLEEFELSLSGTVNANSAAHIGHLIGAKVIVSGTVFPVGKQIYLVAKVIGVETSRSFGETAKFGGEDELENAVTALAEKIGTVITEHRSELIAKIETPEARIKRLKTIVGNKGNGKKVYVSIPEKHFSRAIPDPAVQTEILHTFQQLGFDITEKPEEADIKVKGEAFSERAGQRGQLISCRSRAEIKHFDSRGELFSVDRQSDVAIDLAENIAAKKSLQKTGSALAERLIERVVK